jgi:hypothetical protein
MKLCGDTLTLFNARLDKVNDTTVYEKTVISGISWYSTIKTVVGDTGLKSANQFTIRIPLDADFSGKAYCDPASYTAADDVSGLFTLKQGDVVVKGTVPDTITTPAQIHKAYPETAFTIQGVIDNRRALNAKHWRVVGA